jgi:hypothetical protein
VDSYRKVLWQQITVQHLFVLRKSEDLFDMSKDNKDTQAHIAKEYKRSDSKREDGGVVLV